MLTDVSWIEYKNNSDDCRGNKKLDIEKRIIYMTKIAHLIHDAIFFEQMFDRLDGMSNVTNEYIYILSKKESRKKNVYLKHFEKIKIIIQGSYEYRKLLQTYYDCIFIHYLSFSKAAFVNHYKCKTKFIWSAWGSDYLSKIKYNYFQTITLSYIYRYNFFYLIRIFYNRFYKNRRGINDAVKKIDYCSAVVPTEFKYIKKIKGFTAEQVVFNTGGLFKTSENFDNLGDGIWIGNSGTWSNNHFDVFDKLKKLNITDRKIIMPISYGNMNSKCIRKLVRTGESIFGDKILFLEKFLPLEEYRKLQTSAAFVIYNHNCQQAVGNILISLFNGMKIFLSKISPVYEYFKSIGFIIYTFQEELSVEALQEPLSNEEKMINRQVYNSYYSQEKIYNNTCKLFEYLQIR
jgi:hypothetical protein